MSAKPSVRLAQGAGTRREEMRQARPFGAGAPLQGRGRYPRTDRRLLKGEYREVSIEEIITLASPAGNGLQADKSGVKKPTE